MTGPGEDMTDVTAAGAQKFGLPGIGEIGAMLQDAATSPSPSTVHGVLVS